MSHFVTLRYILILLVPAYRAADDGPLPDGLPRVSEAHNVMLRYVMLRYVTLRYVLILLMFPPPPPPPLPRARRTTLVALLLIVLGNGAFKPNISTQARNVFDMA